MTVLYVWWQYTCTHTILLCFRHGSEDKLVTMMGVMQALVSCVQDNHDNIRCVIAGEHKCVFLVRGPIILVAVTRTQESMQQILFQLTYVYNQILSVLTYTQLSKIFKQRQNYDLRRLLAGAEKFIDNLLNVMDKDACFLLGAVRCLPLPSAVRDTIGQSIVRYASVKVGTIYLFMVHCMINCNLNWKDWIQIKFSSKCWYVIIYRIQYWRVTPNQTGYTSL